MAKYSVELKPVRYKKNGQDCIGYQSYVDGVMTFDGSHLPTAIVAAGERLLKLQRERQETWEKENGGKK